MPVKPRRCPWQTSLQIYPWNFNLDKSARPLNLHCCPLQFQKKCPWKTYEPWRHGPVHAVKNENNSIIDNFLANLDACLTQAEQLHTPAAASARGSAPGAGPRAEVGVALAGMWTSSAGVKIRQKFINYWFVFILTAWTSLCRYLLYGGRDKSPNQKVSWATKSLTARKNTEQTRPDEEPFFPSASGSCDNPDLANFHPDP